MNKYPKVSIIIPVYNSEIYLKRCIDSIVGQGIGVENIQLILVNDGSSDKSEEICLEYVQKYPDNVVYHKQENAGVSAARNKGIELACGEITGFLDSDDVLSKEACNVVYRYFQIVRDYVDVAVIPVCNFGARGGQHVLNKKFAEGTRTVFLENANWYDTCTRAAQAFFRTEVLKRHRFDVNLTLFEDTKFINEILLEKMRLGVVAEATYFYRRYPGESDSSTSLTVGATSNKKLYLDTPKGVSLYFLLRYGEKAPIHLQFLALAEMRWRIFYNNVRPSEILSKDEYKEYQMINEKILEKVEDQTILQCDLYNFWQKIYLLNMKYKRDILSEAAVDENDILRWNGNPIFNFGNDLQINLMDLEIEGASLIIRGYIIGIVVKELLLYANVNGKLIGAEITDDVVEATVFPLELKTYKHSVFSVSVPLTKTSDEISFLFKIGEKESEISRLGVYQKGIVEHVLPPVQIREGYIINRTEKSIVIQKKKIRYLSSVYKRKVFAKGKQLYQKVRRKLHVHR